MTNSPQDSGSTRALAHTLLGLRGNMDFYRNRYHNINRISLLITGLWPYNNTRLALVQRIVCLLVVCSFINFQICKFCTTELTVDFFIDAIAPLLFSVISVVKYVSSWLYTDFIARIYENIKKEWCLITDPVELKIMQKAAEEGNFYVMCESMFCYVGTILFLSLQYIPYALDFMLPLNESRPNYHPFQAEYFVDSDEYFLPILLHMQICIILSMTLIVSSDASIVSFLLHTCGMINITGYRLSHVFDCASRPTDAELRTLLCDQITSIVRLHLNCKKRVSAYVNIFALSYVVQMILIVITLTGLLLQLNKALKTLDDIGFLLLTICRVVGHFLVVFLNIVPGQRLTDCSGNFYRDVYSGRWYDAPLESKKLLMIVMACTMEPWKISVGHFLHCSFETFATIVQTTFSYFTVIHSVQE